MPAPTPPTDSMFLIMQICFAMGGVLLANGFAIFATYLLKAMWR